MFLAKGSAHLLAFRFVRENQASGKPSLSFYLEVRHWILAVIRA